jgi:hypothetical protein
MLILLTLPVIAVVAAVQRYLQCCAPSNLLARRVRAATPTFRMAVSLLVLAAVLLALMHAVAKFIAVGGSGWLNIVVLVLAWDAMKMALLAARSGLGALAFAAHRAVHPAARRCRRARSLAL